VLFVDYMAEHLTPGGRAGIIVPEGIIFQSQTAYTQLRKMLVEEYLVAVVSLPQGVFNPYSGVKTSILFIDKARTRKASDILFVRVDDDGYDLGATRKHRGDGDLPTVARFIGEWFNAIDTGNLDVVPAVRDRALRVSRAEIAATRDYRLTADTYRQVVNHTGHAFPWVRLGDLIRPSEHGRVGEASTLPILSMTMTDGLVDQSDKFKKRIASENISDYKRVALGELVVGFPIDEGVLGTQNLYPFAAVSPAYSVWGVDEGRVYRPFFELVLRSDAARSRYRLKMRGTAGRRRTLDRHEFLAIQIPLPPLEVQKEIVAEIEGYQKVIDGARAVLDNYRPHIPIHPDWPIVELGEIAEIIRGITFAKSDQLDHPTADSLAVATTKAAQHGGIVEDDLYYIPRSLLKDDAKLLRRGDILISTANSLHLLGRTTHIDRELERPTSFGAFMSVIRPSNRVRDVFLLVCARADRAIEFYRQHAKTTTNISNLNTSELAHLTVPLPPLDTQRAIVAEIEAEQALVNANRELITRFENKIQATLARVWGEDEPTPAEA
jgi:type I restriction enzyme M protein